MPRRKDVGLHRTEGMEMEIRFAHKHEAEACNDFYNRVSRTNRTLAQWQWGYLRRDFPADQIPFVLVMDQGSVVGTQAFIPIRMIDERGTFWTVKSEETLVDPSYRGKKLFEKMYERLFGFLKQHGIHCIWGFTPATKAFEQVRFTIPRMTSQMFFPFTGLSVVTQLEKYSDLARPGVIRHMKTGVFRVAGSMASAYSSLWFRRSSSLSAGTTADLEIRVLDSPPSQAGELSERFIRQYGGTTIYRDVPYLQWRLFDNPFVKAVMLGAFIRGELAGWVAYALGDDGMGYLVDILVAPSSNLKQDAAGIAKRLLAAAVDDLRKTGAHGVRGWHVNGHPFDAMILRIAQRLGFYHIKRGYAVVLFINGESDRREALALFDRWFVSRIFTEGVLG